MTRFHRMRRLTALSFMSLVASLWAISGAAADSTPGMQRRGSLPVISCDGCGAGEPLRLYYIGLPESASVLTRDPRASEAHSGQRPTPMHLQANCP